MQGLFGESGSGALTLPQGASTDGGSEKAPKKSRRASAGDKLTKAAAEIKAAPHKAQAAYLARELILCTLPHRDPGEVPVWARQNGNFTLMLQSGYDGKSLQPIGLPYGSIPRLILLWVVTEAVRTKSRNIQLGNTLNDFLREIGLDPKTGGGKYSHARRLKEQMMKLFECRISFKYSAGDENEGRKASLNMELAKEAQYWWNFKRPEQGTLFQSHIVLGEAFFEAITASPVPVDFRALKALKQSPFALDLYTWATYRVYTLQQSKRQEVRIPLSSLKEQFGGEYSRADHFKTALEEGLAKVQKVFPALDYAFEKQILILRDGKGGRAILSHGERPAMGRAAAHEMVQRISHKGRAWFQENYPRHDIETAIGDFNTWREGQKIESANPDAHFRAFVKKWAR